MKNSLEKTLKREDGTRVRIVVELSDPRYGQLAYSFNITMCAKGKRKFLKGVDTDGYEFLDIPYVERQAYIIAKQLEVITKEELLQAKIDLWKTLRPKL